MQQIEVKREEKHRKDVSIVVPLFNEAESLLELYQGIIEALEQTKFSFEVLFVDDGTRDGSFDIIREIRQKDDRVRAVRLRRNYGKSAALAVGFESVNSNAVVTMDADLQDDPTEIPAMVSLLAEGYDLVSGWKKNRKDPFSKRFPSKLFNWVTGIVSGLRLHDFNCGLKAYRRQVLETIIVYGELHRYLPVLAHWAGFRVTEMPVLHHPRKHGISKFGLGRFTHGFFDLLTVYFVSNYTRRPLHLFGAFGFLSFGSGFIIALYLTWLWVSDVGIGTRPLLQLSVLLMGLGIQLVSMGLIAEMMVHHARRTEDYSVHERLE